MKCAFCEIPEIQKRKIVENKFAWVFPTNIPIVPGHLLICPKRCVSSFSELSNLEKNAIFELLENVKIVLKKLFGAQGFNYAWNEEKVAGQSVPHFHLHVVPRKEGDSGVYEYEPRKFLYRPGSRESSSEEELQKVAQVIRDELIN